jgi:hypothetical protein
MLALFRDTTVHQIFHDLGEFRCGTSGIEKKAWIKWMAVLAGDGRYREMIIKRP